MNHSFQGDAHEYWPIDLMIGVCVPVELWKNDAKTDEASPSQSHEHVTSPNHTPDTPSDKAWLSFLVISVLLLLNGVCFFYGQTKLVEAWPRGVHETINHLK